MTSALRFNAVARSNTNDDSGAPDMLAGNIEVIFYELGEATSEPRSTRDCAPAILAGESNVAVAGEKCVVSSAGTHILETLRRDNRQRFQDHDPLCTTMGLFLKNVFGAHLKPELGAKESQQKTKKSFLNKEMVDLTGEDQGWI